MRNPQSPSGRRSFLKGAAGLGRAAFLPSFLKGEYLTVASQSGGNRKTHGSSAGKTGLKLPIVSIGAASYEASLYQRALDEGMVHIDTSQYYYNGRHEEMVGQGASRAESGIRLSSPRASSWATAPRARFPHSRKKTPPSFPNRSISASNGSVYPTSTSSTWPASPTGIRRSPNHLSPACRKLKKPESPVRRPGDPSKRARSHPGGDRIQGPRRRSDRL